MQRRDSGYTGQRMLKIKLPGRRKRARKDSWMDMQRADVTGEDSRDGGR